MSKKFTVWANDGVFGPYEADDERYAALKRAIDAEYDARMLYEMRTQTMLALEPYLTRYHFRRECMLIRSQVWYDGLHLTASKLLGGTAETDMSWAA